MQNITPAISALYTGGGIFQFRTKLEIYDSNNNLVDVVTDGIIDGQVTAAMYRQSARDFSITLANATGKFTPGPNNLIWIDKKFIPYRGIVTPDGQTVWFAQGVFPCSKPGVSEDKGKMQVKLSGPDKMAFLGTTKDVVQIKAGTKIDTAITSILIGRESRVLLDPVPNTADYKLPYDMTFDKGTDYQEILTKLAGVVTWDIFYDVNGYLRFRAPIDPLTTAPSFTIDAPNKGFNVYMSADQEIDDTQLANHIVVIGGSAQTGFFYWEWEDTDPNSPTSIQKIGRRTYLHNRGNPDPVITSQTLAEARGKYERRKRAAVTYKHKVKMFTVPYLEHADVIGVQNPWVGASGNYQLVNISIPLVGTETSGECWKVMSFAS